MSENSESDKIFKKSRAPRGEALTPCSDKEWDASDEAYGAELLNVKKKPNRVNVFSASEKPTSAFVVQEEFSPKSIEPEQPEFHSLARKMSWRNRKTTKSQNGINSFYLTSI
ncbi:unnamed protein product [Caenorhabditis angaria]|uniref:Uncharacterized protein n=1 Tax=Caenorhabditis angaria TaxID=860376 RepID=A0A9P1IGN1_9PELO|nr:unnamed protein product [Caenorhabditis angaria]